MQINNLNFIKVTSTLLSLFLSSSTVEGLSKIDCHPLAGASKETCEKLGCIWYPVPTPLPEPSGHALPSKPEKPRVDEPWCYYPDDYVGYKVVEIDELGFKVKIVRVKPSGLPDDVSQLIIEITDFGSIVRIKIYDPNSRRFEPELPKLQLGSIEKHDGPKFKVSVDTDGHLVVERVSTATKVFETDLKKLIYSDKFIQLNSRLNSPFVYGLGEHYDTFLKRTDSYKVYSMYNTDQLPLPGGRRSYGGFPFYINLDSGDLQNAHGVYLRNSNGMDIVLQSDQSVTFRPIGGILDFIIFSGPTPNDVIAQYHQTVGMPDLPPRWALGFHLCRYNYNSLDKTKLVWERTRQAGIPFDVQWNDVDYMDKHNDFTYDHDKFENLPDFVNEIHSKGMHYVVLIDPGISQEDGYYPYELGKLMDIFIKNATNQTLVGKVWNDSGRTVFPDFSNVLSIDYWTAMFADFHRKVPFDGAWIDMNDISNFVDGSLQGCPSDHPLEKTIYNPGGGTLQHKSLCLSAQHRAGAEYNVHNLYSFYEAIATQEAMKTIRPNRRSIIISRSSSVGQGHFSGHWSGDVLSNWDYIKWSIPSLIEHSMYGYSLIGSDICGFSGNTTPQLCARWSTLGAFYTFSRNHNDDKSIDQDPVALGPEVVLANKNAYTTKYSLLPYLYSLIHRHHKYGEPAIRSVPFEFYTTDKEALKVEYQFMWGKGLMISPIVDQDTYMKSTYLPAGRWYETDIIPALNDIEFIKMIDSKGEWHNSNNISLHNIPLFYRGGHILPTYSKSGSTITEIAKQPYSLKIALCPMNKAHGELFDDDGESLGGNYNHATLQFEDKVLNVTMNKDDYTYTIAFDKVTIYGFKAPINGVKILSDDGKEIPFKIHGHVLSFNLYGATVSKNKNLVVKCY